MLDIKFIRENPDAVRENIKKSFRMPNCPWWTRYWHWTRRTGPLSAKPMS
mgnify:CR=1 FL=1